jgi:processive 1,2-diacylglycerol beta-glucosyltransferase
MKIFILTTVAGAGHNQAARAIQKALQAEAPGHRVEYLDAAELGTSLVRRMYNDTYLKMVNKTPALWGYFYDRYDHRKLGRTKDKLKSFFARINSRPLVRRLQDGAPDAIVATHFYPAEIALRLKEKGRLSARIDVVITDFQPHSFWVLDGVDRYMVADDETAHALAGRGVARERIAVTGIPVDPKFAIRRDRGELASRLGIDAGRFTVLVSSGGMGVGPMEEVVRALVAQGRVPQVLVVCGKNEKLKAALDSLPAPKGVALKVFGFVTNMEELMGAADVLVSKCGGLTTAEALSVGLPMLILNPIPGQEAQNSDLLLERGVALKANDVAALTYKVSLLADDPARLAAMRERIRALARPDAASAVARLAVRAVS